MKNFIEILNENELTILQNSIRVNVARPEHTAWPSEALANLGPINVGECRRALYYRITGVQPTDDMTLRSKHICDCGNLYESTLIDKFKRSNIHIDSQRRVTFKVPQSTNNIVVSGKMDAIIKNSDKLASIEIKSVAGFGLSEIFGYQNKRPLPRASHLMQAILYKYFIKYVPQPELQEIDDMYLMYVDRGSGSVVYFKIDLDDKGYPLITTITENGTVLGTLATQTFPDYQNMIDGSVIGTDDLGRIAELRIRPSDIFERFESVYDHVEQKKLPPKDFTWQYNEEELKREFVCGRIGKIKYNKALKGKETYGDFKCSYCSYRTKCMSDSGLNMK